MLSSTHASIIWVKYGFDGITLPKLYNTNVNCAILQSFLKNTCATDVEKVCKQESTQLSIELAALTKDLQAVQSRNAATLLAEDKSVTSASSASVVPHHPGGVSSSRAIAPKMDVYCNDLTHDDDAEIVAKKILVEKQLEIVAAASKLVKELLTGTAFVDLVDDHGTRLNLDLNGKERANNIFKTRAQYTAVAVTVDDNGISHVLPLVFTLQKNTTAATAE